MDRPVVYADLNLFRNSGPESSSPPSLPRDVCQGPTWHPFALKLGCAGIIFLVLCVIGLSVSVIPLIKKSSIENCSVIIQENRNKTTEKPSQFKCPMNWQQVREKCFFFETNVSSWNNSRTDCSRKDSSLLLIQDQEELKLIQNKISDVAIQYWIGLHFTEKNWKWINDSFLHSNTIQVFGTADENSCACISKTELISENCGAENKWICQIKK